MQYGDGKLKYATIPARFQIDAAEEASVIDVLTAFITGKRDAGREVRPVYYMPAEITRNPLPEPVWGTRGGESAGEVMADIFGGPKQMAQAQAGGKPKEASKVVNPAVIEHIYEDQKRGLTDGTCVAEMVPIDGISNPALINGGVDFWAIGHGRQRDEVRLARRPLQPPPLLADVVTGFLGRRSGIRLHATGGGGTAGRPRRSSGS